ncbi:MAG: hypothetical protein JWN98_1407, partial [Abditibacteriota bacterium]|nr:hypothetical protein [Abditibacteriota bacterium]
QKRGDGSKKALYHGVLETMDEQLGPLFNFIRHSEKLRNNTLILFASDNGPEPGAGSAQPLRGTKAQLYEGGVREPLIVWAPGLLPADQRNATNTRTVISGIDFLPSLLPIAGVKVPAEVTFDGIDLSEALLGKAETVRQQPLFWKRPPDRPGPPRAPLPDLAVRDANWKLLVQENGARPELFDLGIDPGETTNLAAAQPAVVQRLQQVVLAWNQTLPAAQDVSALQTRPRRNRLRLE